MVAHLASGHEDAERPTFCIGDGVQLRIHTAFGATDEAPKTPFFYPQVRRRAVRLQIGRVLKTANAITRADVKLTIATIYNLQAVIKCHVGHANRERRRLHHTTLFYRLIAHST